MDTLAERIVQAIEMIKTDRDLDRNITDEALARKLGTNKNTIGDYRRKKGLIKGIVLERLATVYRFNPEWLLSGKGQPFAAAESGIVQEGGAPYEEGEDEAPIRISDSIRMAIEVLESNSASARMLARTIRQSHDAVQLEKEVARLQAEIEDLKKAAKDRSE